MREPCLEGAGDTARDTGGRVEGGLAEAGRGDTARKLEGALAPGAGDGVSLLSVDDLFIDE